MLNQRCWRSYRTLRKHVNELQRIYDSLASVMIVRDDERRFGVLGDGADALCPRLKLFSGIEKVVSFRWGRVRIVGEPSIVAPSMKPNVTYRRCRAI